MKEIFKVVSGALIILFAIWGFFYSFHIWPAPHQDMVWWTVPHAITAAAIAIVVGCAGGAMINDVID